MLQSTGCQLSILGGAAAPADPQLTAAQGSSKRLWPGRMSKNHRLLPLSCSKAAQGKSGCTFCFAFPTTNPLGQLCPQGRCCPRVPTPRGWTDTSASFGAVLLGEALSKFSPKPGAVILEARQDRGATPELLSCPECCGLTPPSLRQGSSAGSSPAQSNLPPKPSQPPPFTSLCVHWGIFSFLTSYMQYQSPGMVDGKYQNGKK